MLKDVPEAQINKEIHLKILVKYIFYLVKDGREEMIKELTKLSQNHISFGSCAPAPLWGVEYALLNNTEAQIESTLVQDEKTLIEGLEKGDYSLIISSRPSSNFCANSTASFPFSFNSILFFLRLNKESPKSSSNLCIDLVSPGWEINNSSAAFEMVLFFEMDKDVQVG